MPAWTGLPRLADPSKVAIHTFASPERFLAAQGVAGRVVEPPAAGFRATLSRIDLDRVRVRVGESSHPVTMAGGTADCHAFVLASRPAPPRRLSGREVPHHVIFHPRPNELLTGASPGGQPWPWTTITLGYETLERDGAALAGRAVAPSRFDMTLVLAPEPARQRLLGLAADAARLARTRPEIAEDQSAARAFSGAILDALIECLLQGDRVADRAAARRHYQIMSRLEVLLRDRSEDVLSLADICAAVGAGARSLQLVCQEFAGVDVMQYVRSHRLHAVRRALLAADRGAVRVADVAMRYGFWELGRFAGAYRAMFAELPSATLRHAG
jgi:AraC-like DNA-binding protein